MPGETCADCEILPRMAAAARRAGLTLREIQVLHYSAHGEPIKCIADILKISLRTVVFHRVHICQKIGARSMEAAIYSVLT